MQPHEATGTGGEAKVTINRVTKLSTYYDWKLGKTAVEVRVSKTAHKTNVVCMSCHSTMCNHAFDVVEFLEIDK